MTTRWSWWISSIGGGFLLPRLRIDCTIGMTTPKEGRDRHPDVRSGGSRRRRASALNRFGELTHLNANEHLAFGQRSGRHNGSLSLSRMLTVTPWSLGRIGNEIRELRGLAGPMVPVTGRASGRRFIFAWACVTETLAVAWAYLRKRGRKVGRRGVSGHLFALRDLAVVAAGCGMGCETCTHR